MRLTKACWEAVAKLFLKLHSVALMNKMCSYVNSKPLWRPEDAAIDQNWIQSGISPVPSLRKLELYVTDEFGAKKQNSGFFDVGDVGPGIGAEILASFVEWEDAPSDSNYLLKKLILPNNLLYDATKNPACGPRILECVHVNSRFLKRARGVTGD